nr:NADH-plastoquinone oxidoreductase subunit K [Ipomoea batatas]
MGWLLLAFPPKNRMCEFPRIRLKWRRPFPSRLEGGLLFININKDIYPCQREGFQNKQKNNIPLSVQQLEVYLNKMSGFHSKSSPHSMQNSFADILLPKWNCTSRIGLKRHDPRLILDMYPLFQVHHKENENQDLLYPVSNGNYEQIEHLSRVSIPSHES